MSYVRFGDDSDVYVYRCVYGGFRIHIASNVKTQSGWMPLGSPLAGRVLTAATRQECVKVLDDAKANGLKVPDCAYARLEFEIMIASRKSNRPLTHRGRRNHYYFKLQKMFYKKSPQGAQCL